MRKLHCSVFIVLSIGALNPQAHSLFAAKPQKIPTFLTKFSALGHHQDNVQHEKKNKKMKLIDNQLSPAHVTQIHTNEAYYR